MRGIRVAHAVQGTKTVLLAKKDPLNMKKTSLRALFSALLPALLLAPFASAVAGERMTSTFACFQSTEDRPEADFDGTSHGVRNRSEGINWQWIDLRCPVVTDGTFAPNTIYQVNVQGFDGHSSHDVYAMACTSWKWSTGGRCGNSLRSAATGYYNVTLTSGSGVDALYYWRTAPWDYPYVLIQLPGRGDVGFTSSVGYTLYTP